MMFQKSHVPPVIKQKASTAPWRVKVLLAIAFVLACTWSVIALLDQTTGVAQTVPGGGYGDEYGSGGYGSEMGGYGSEMGGYGSMSSMMSGASPRQELMARVTPLVNRLRKAEGDDEKKSIRTELSESLGDYFDQDLERRLAEIASIDARVKRLRDQCEQRKQAKEEILQLQLKVLENQAAGLGFFGQAAANQGMGMGGAMGEEEMRGYPGSMHGGPGVMGVGPGDMGGYGPGVVGRFGGEEGYDAMPPGMDAGMGEAHIPIPLEFLLRTRLESYDQPLDEMLDFLRRVTKANIYVDQQELKQARVKLDAPVTITLLDVSAATALDLITANLSNDLGVRYDDGIAIIGRRTEPTVAHQNQWGSDRSQRSQDVLRQLSGTGDYDFIELPLADVVTYLQDTASVSVFLSEHSLQRAGISSDAPVSISLKKVKHRTALRLILDSVDKALYYSIVDGIVVIAANQKEPQDGAFEAMYGCESSAFDPYAAQPATDGASEEDPERPIAEDDEIPGGLAMVGSGSAVASISGAEELAILEATLDSAEEKLRLVEAIFQQGETSALEFAAARGEFEIATKRLEKAKRENAAQDRLLELEVQRALVELDAVEATLEESMEVNQHSPGTIPSSGVKQAELAVQKAKLNAERAQTLLELHREPVEADSPE